MLSYRIAPAGEIILVLNRYWTDQMASITVVRVALTYTSIHYVHLTCYIANIRGKESTTTLCHFFMSIDRPVFLKPDGTFDPISCYENAGVCLF